MPRLIVAGSENDVHFAVIDFTNPMVPGLVRPDAGFGAGCRVYIDNNLVAVGSVLTGEVTVFDVSAPNSPVKGAVINTMLSGIGAIAIMGRRVVVGEYVNSFKARVTLIDFSNLAAPVVLGMAQTNFANVTVGTQTSAAIASIAFVSTNVVVASGPSDFHIAQIDFTNPAAPVSSQFLPGLSGAPTIDADAAANTLAAGDNNGTGLKLLNATTHAVIGTANTTLGGVGSVAVSNMLVLCGSPNDFLVALVNFSGGVTVTKFDPQLGGGSTTDVKSPDGACGAILGSSIKLFNVTVNPPTQVGATVNTQLPSISTIKISVFTLPAIVFNPASLNFATVRVGTSSTKSLSITNTGTLPLTVSNLQSSNARYTFAPPGPFTIAPGQAVTISVTFAPNAETSFNGNLTMTTNDPAHPTASVPFSGIGGLPHISLSTASLNLGSVAVCLSGTGTLTLGNTGALPLTISSIASSGAPFSVIPSSATIPAGGTTAITVQFTPTATGAANGTLTIVSDDPNTPSRQVTLTGTGLPTPPAMIALTPAALNFGATPVQFFIGLRITISNSGPCQPLNFTMTSSGAPYFLTASDPTTVPPSALSLTDGILHGTSKRYVVVFAPTTTGATPGTLTIASNDPANPTVVIPLSGTAVLQNPVALEFVLDRSGSMAGAAPGGITKMDALKAAVSLFADIVTAGQGDEVGSVQFDDQFNVLTAFATYTVAQQTAVKNDVMTLTPRGNTSIGGGLQLAQPQVSGSTLARKVIVVFTDGMENTPPMIASVAPSITGASIELYAVGLGQPQNISTAALNQLAASANGKFFQTDDTLVLRKDFVQVLADAYRNNMAADPIFTIQTSQTVNIPVQITKCERRITFILNWDNPLSQVGFTVQAPDGTVFNPNSPAVNRLVRFTQRPGYSFYQIAFPPIDPGSGLAIGPLQVGTWTLRITGTSLASATERCATNVVVDSDLNLSADLSVSDISSPAEVSVNITDNGNRVANAKVTLRLTSPTKSLAATMTPAVIARALGADHHPIASGQKPSIPTTITNYPLRYDERRRRFAIQMPPLKVDGSYLVEIFATGQACGGTFERYTTFSRYIGRRADGGATAIEVSPAGAYAVTVVVIPRDSSKKPLGPGLASSITAWTRNAAAFPIIDRGDGSYAFRVVWNGAYVKPELRVRIGSLEKTVVLPTKVAGPRTGGRSSRKTKR